MREERGGNGVQDKSVGRDRKEVQRVRRRNGNWWLLGVRVGTILSMEHARDLE